MSGLLDLHTLIGLQNGWSYYRDAIVNFRELFPHVETALVDDWHLKLSAKKVNFRPHGAAGSDEFPVVAVQLMNETHQHEPLGGYAYTKADGRDVEAMILKQTIGITILTQSAEITRALHVVIRAIMQLAKTDFLKAGYLDLMFDQTEELAPQEELAAEELGIFVRRQRYTARAQVEVPHIGEAGEPFGMGPGKKPWFFFVDDIKTIQDPNDPTGVGRTLDVDGDPGGVVPSS
jgi:hypothetical protein